MKPETKNVATLPESERALLQEAFAIAQETGIRTVDFAAQRLRAVLTIGHTLNHWRGKVAKDHWYAWLDVNVFPIVEITVRSLTNWMRLAESEKAGKVKIEAGIGVRSALIQAGIIPANDKTPSTATERVKGAPATILSIVRVSHQVERLNLDELSEQQQRTIATALLPVVTIYQRLAVKLHRSQPEQPKARKPL